MSRSNQAYQGVVETVGDSGQEYYQCSIDQREDEIYELLISEINLLANEAAELDRDDFSAEDKYCI